MIIQPSETADLFFLESCDTVQKMLTFKSEQH